MCVFCENADKLNCAQDFYSIEQEALLVYSFNNSTDVYTVSESGQIKLWDYDLIADGTLSCVAITTLNLNLNETITAASYNASTKILMMGTSDGRIIFYDMVSKQGEVVYVNVNAISAMSSGPDGYLFATSTGEINFSEDGVQWIGPSVTPAATVSALYLYSTTSWLVANTNGNMYYTNNRGESYVENVYPKLEGEAIKEFEKTNDSIIHAITDTRYYHSFDAACSWQAIDLSHYFSSLYSMELCPTNPYVIYFAGLSADATQSYIIKMDFGA
jgi:WD40 repeat protein